jgi:hypothetical protein
MRRILQALALAAALTLVPGVAYAGPGGNGGHGGTGGSSSLSLVMVTDNNADLQPNWGDTVTFEVTTTSQYPTVTLDCFQNGTQVYSASAGWYSTYPWPWARNMPLSSQDWSGGAASCTATLSDSATLAELSFTANA